MKTEVINQLRFAASALMRLTVSLLCALFLMLAYFLKTPFLIQAIIFAFSLANMFATLKDGFNSLCDFSVGANSLVFMCALSALLQGAVGFGQRNCFVYTAFVFSMFVLGEYLEEREFGKVVKNQSCLKKIWCNLP